MASRQTFQHYQISIGPGGKPLELRRAGTEAVFLAYDERFGSFVEFHILNPPQDDSTYVDRFLAIADRGKVVHGTTTLPTLLTAGEESEALYYTTPVRDGESLEDYLAGLTSFSLLAAIEMAQQLVEAFVGLRAIPELGSHTGRDGLRVVRDRSRAVIRLTDLGLPRATSEGGDEEQAQQNAFRVIGGFLCRIIAGKNSSAQALLPDDALQGLPEDLKTKLRILLLSEPTEQISSLDDLDSTLRKISDVLGLNSGAMVPPPLPSMQLAQGLPDVDEVKAALVSEGSAASSFSTLFESSAYRYVDPSSWQPRNFQLLPPAGLIAGENFRIVSELHSRSNANEQPNLIQVYGTKIVGRCFGYSEEVLEGISLQDWVETREHLPDPAAVGRLLSQIDRGLVQAEACGAKVSTLCLEHLWLHTLDRGQDGVTAEERFRHHPVSEWPSYVVKLRACPTLPQISGVYESFSDPEAGAITGRSFAQLALALCGGTDKPWGVSLPPNYGRSLLTLFSEFLGRKTRRERSEFLQEWLASEDVRRAARTADRDSDSEEDSRPEPAGLVGGGSVTKPKAASARVAGSPPRSGKLIPMTGGVSASDKAATPASGSTSGDEQDVVIAKPVKKPVPTSPGAVFGSKNADNDSSKSASSKVSRLDEAKEKIRFGKPAPDRASVKTRPGDPTFKKSLLDAAEAVHEDSEESVAREREITERTSRIRIRASSAIPDGIGLAPRPSKPAGSKVEVVAPTRIGPPPEKPPAGDDVTQAEQPSLSGIDKLKLRPIDALKPLGSKDSEEPKGQDKPFHGQPQSAPVERSDSSESVFSGVMPKPSASAPVVAEQKTAAAGDADDTKFESLYFKKVVASATPAPPPSIPHDEPPSGRPWLWPVIMAALVLLAISFLLARFLGGGGKGPVFAGAEPTTSTSIEMGRKKVPSRPQPMVPKLLASQNQKKLSAANNTGGDNSGSQTEVPVDPVVTQAPSEPNTEQPTVVATQSPLPQETAPVPTTVTPAARVDRVYELLTESKVLIDQERLVPGVAKINDALDLDPENSMARASAGAVYRAVGSSEVPDRLLSELKRSADSGVVDAAALYGRHLQEDDPGAAVGYLKLAAEEQHVESMRLLGGILSSNFVDGIEQDFASAALWFEKAADLGDEKSYYLVGECYILGKGVPHDAATGVKYLEKAVEVGDPRALDLLGFCYTKGQGVDQDFGKARELYSKAVGLGHLNSMANLGVLYMTGRGGEAEPGAAVELFRRGSEAGNMNCMFFYANCLENGHGISQDESEAMTWYRKAARMGEPKAKDWCRAHEVAFTTP